MGRDPLYEKIPRYNLRIGDVPTASRNGSEVICERDRVDTVDSGYGTEPGSGAVRIVAGRRGPDPSVLDDPATIYLSQRTDPDLQAGTEGVGLVQRQASGMIVRADCIRLTARTDLKVSVGRAYLLISSDGQIVLDGEISLGEGAADRIIKGDEFARFWSTLSIPTPVGPSGPPPPLPPSVFSSRTVKVR